MSLILQALRKAKGLSQNNDGVGSPSYLKSFGFGQGNREKPKSRVPRTLLRYVAPAVVIAAALAFGFNAWMARSRAPGIAPPEVALSVPAPLPMPEPEVLPEALPEPQPELAVTVTVPRPVPRPATRVISEPVPAVATLAPAAAARVDSPTPATRPEPAVPSRDPFELAVFFQRTGENQRALAQYQRVLDSDPLNSAALSNLGLLHLAMNNVSDAIRTLRSATYANPDYDKAHNNLGIALMRDGQLSEAAREFDRALQLNPRNTESLTNLGILSRDTGKPDKAITYYLRALQINPASPETHYNLAFAYESQGEYGKAIDALQQFLKFGSSEHPDTARQVETRIEELTARRQR